jgi:hypothetical protein
MSKLNKILNDERIDLRLSYSRLSDFDRNGPIALIRPTKSETESLKHGSLTDTLINDQFLKTNEFEKQYFIFNGEKPTATLGKIVDIVLENYTKLPTEEEFLNIIEKNGFWSRISNNVLKGYINEPSFIEYLTLQLENKNKIIITNDDYLKAKNAVELLTTHEFTKDYFYNDLENHYQVEFNIKLKGFKFRGVLDKMTVDHKNKMVYFEDIKTGSGKHEKFIETFLKYRYYFQSGIYCLAFDEICKNFKLKGYELAPFKFLYVTSSEKHPLVWEVPEKWNKASLNGFRIKQYKYKGIYELIDDIYFHWKNKQFDYSREICEKRGCLILNDKFIDIDE